MNEPSALVERPLTGECRDTDGSLAWRARDFVARREESTLTGRTCQVLRGPCIIDVPPYNRSVIATNGAGAGVIYPQNRGRVSRDAGRKGELFDGSVLFTVNVKRELKGNRQKEKTQKRDSSCLPVSAQHYVARFNIILFRQTMAAIS